MALFVKRVLKKHKNRNDGRKGKNSYDYKITETDKIFNFGFSYSRFALEDTNSVELEENHEDEIENNKSKQNDGKKSVSFGFLLVGEVSFKLGKSKLWKEF